MHNLSSTKISLDLFEIIVTSDDQFVTIFREVLFRAYLEVELPEGLVKKEKFFRYIRGSCLRLLELIRGALEIGMLLIWERSLRKDAKGEFVPSTWYLSSLFFSLVLSRFLWSFPPPLLSISFLLDLSLSPNDFQPLKNSPSLSRRTAIRLHRPTARRAAFASNARQGVFFFFFSFFDSFFFLLFFFFLSFLITLRNIPPGRAQRGDLT